MYYEQYFANRLLGQSRLSGHTLQCILPSRGRKHPADRPGGYLCRMSDRFCGRHRADHSGVQTGFHHQKSPVVYRKTDSEHLRGSIPRNTYDRPGDVYLFWCHAVSRHHYGNVVRCILYRVDQHRSLHGRDRARRYLIRAWWNHFRRSGTDRRCKSNRYDALSDDAVRHFPADAAKHHSANWQQPDHQHQRFLGTVRNRCYRAVLCGKTDSRSLLLVV